MNLPYISIKQMAEVDRSAVENGLEIKQMMEYAGLNIARFTQRYVESSGSVLIMCGKGHNGGDGLAAARHLINWGYKVRITLAEENLKVTSKIHYDMLMKMDADFGEFDDSYDVIVDALLGYNMEGDPRGKYAELIKAANNSNKPILAVDMASGLGHEPEIKPEATLTLALPKDILKNTPNLYVADLGIPSFIYKKAGIEIPPSIFKDESIVSVS